MSSAHTAGRDTSETNTVAPYAATARGCRKSSVATPVHGPPATVVIVVPCADATNARSPTTNARRPSRAAVADGLRFVSRAEEACLVRFRRYMAGSTICALVQ